MDQCPVYLDPHLNSRTTETWLSWLAGDIQTRVYVTQHNIQNYEIWKIARKYKHQLLIILTGWDLEEQAGPNKLGIDPYFKTKAFCESYVKLPKLWEAVVSKMMGTQQKIVLLWYCWKNEFSLASVRAISRQTIC